VACVKISENGVLFKRCAMATGCLLQSISNLRPAVRGPLRKGRPWDPEEKNEKSEKTFSNKINIIIMNHLVTGDNTTKPLSIWNGRL